MNNAKLCALVVAVCVIAPCLVGYVWPTDQGTTTNYVIGNATNIDADVNNANVPYYDYYTDLYNNNMYVFNAFAQPSGWGNVPNQTTTRNTGLPAYTNSISHTETHTTNADGHVTYYMSQWESAFPTAKVFLFDLPSDAQELYAGTEGGSNDVWVSAQRVIYYADSKILYIQSNGGHVTQTALGDADRFLMMYFYSEELTTYTFSYETYSGNSYADPALGWKLPSSASWWFNGYDNRAIDILIKLDDQLNLASSFIVSILTIYIETHPDGYIQMRIYDNVAHENTTLTLAKLGVYEYLLLHIDADRSVVEFSGLNGMSSFMDDYVNAIRHTVTYDWSHPATFNNMLVFGALGRSWLIPRTVSAVATVQGIEDATIDLRAYNAGNSMFDIRNVVYAGSSIEINVNGINIYGTISDRSVTFNTLPGQSFALSDLSISCIDKTVYANGTALYTVSAPITTATMTLNGQWLANIYYHPITDETVSSFGWTVGGFGLDAAGFCAVGLCASAGSGLAAMLYGRRSGAKVFLVLLTSLICGVVYLTVLMGGLS